MKKIKNLAKRGTALLLAVMVLLLAGCGSKDSGTNESSENENKESKEQTESNAKGRYMESDLTLPEGVLSILDMKKLEDGSIGLLDSEKGTFVSKDGGETWELKDTYLLDNMEEGTYVFQAVMGEDGSYFVKYWKDTEEGNYIIDENDAMTDTDSIIIEGEEAAGALEDINSSFRLLYIDKDGNGMPINTPEYVDSIGMLSDGTLLASVENKVYIVDKDSGNFTDFCEVDDGIEYVQQIGNILYFVSSKIEQYDLETKTFIEDPVLDDFSAGKFSKIDGAYDTGGPKSILLCEGDEENSIFIACSDGLYRHVVGGNVIEEIMKGSLSSLGDPSCSLLNMIRKENGEFLIAYLKFSSTSEILIKNYVYDSQAAAIPEKLLKIYSLEENSMIQQAVSEFQKNNSEIYIEYEIGMTEGSGMTKEDAIRNLNTQILSGEGPDIILLDGMPVQSYMEKGILADLSEMLTKDFGQDDFFENIVNSYKKGDSIYAIPSRFQIPVLYTEKTIADRIIDLTTLADEVEKLRNEKETGTITGSFNETETLNKLFDVNAPAWMAEDGTIKKEELTIFLNQAKRIYEAEQKGITSEEGKEHEESAASAEEYLGKDYYLKAVNNALEYLENKQGIRFGRSSCVSSAYMDYSMITSVLDKKENEQEIKLLPGQKGNVFVPVSVIGVCENSSSKELATNFVSYLLSEELQAMSIDTGYPINKKAFSDSLISPYESREEEKEIGFSMAWSYVDEETGKENIGDLQVLWIDEERQQRLEEIVASLDTPTLTDTTIKDVILELGPAALNGEKSVEDVAGEIINKVQIYLSE
ncbi:MAG: extracellular solute-binding protein [Lachnospiraceae bacterium]|nr:extracellular solute-binding protein [Lachnospiraceae bacterium]